MQAKRKRAQTDVDQPVDHGVPLGNTTNAQRTKRVKIVQSDGTQPEEAEQVIELSSSRVRGRILISLHSADRQKKSTEEGRPEEEHSEESEKGEITLHVRPFETTP